MRRSLPFLVLLLATAAACSKSSPDRSPSSESTQYPTPLGGSYADPKQLKRIAEKWKPV